MSNATTTCPKCDALNAECEDFTDRRWVLSDETQVCIWSSPTARPEVDFLGTVQILDYFCCEEHALVGISKYLTLLSATAQWSWVRPVEECSCCAADIDTSKWHKVLTLTVEEGPLYDPDLLDAAYPARFCNRCVPVNANETGVSA
jgi:hypothetical protein